MTRSSSWSFCAQLFLFYFDPSTHSIPFFMNRWKCRGWESMNDKRRIWWFNSTSQLLVRNATKILFVWKRSFYMRETSVTLHAPPTDPFLKTTQKLNKNERQTFSIRFQQKIDLSTIEVYILKLYHSVLLYWLWKKYTLLFLNVVQKESLLTRLNDFFF